MKKHSFDEIKDSLFSLCSLDESDYIIIGFPYEGTVSGMRGTAKAAEVVYETSINIENYSPYQDRSIEELKLCVLESPLIQFDLANYKECLDIIYDTADHIMSMGKKMLSIGGEHSITFPLFQRHYEENSDIALIQFDAHTDLRDEFEPWGSDEPTKYSHASVIKRIYNELNVSDVYQLGIRSGLREEFEFAHEHLNICPFSTEMLDTYLNKIGKDKPIYLTIDTDVLDPSEFNGVGTPEPLGISYKTLLNDLNKLKDYNLQGIDIVEYSPDRDYSRRSAHIMVHLIRELLLIWSHG
jgi:agmatinase